MSKRGIIIHLVVLCAFLFVTGTIDLFHTDGPFGKDPNCPACTFHSSAVAAPTIHLFQVPSLAVIEAVSLPAPCITVEIFFLAKTARAPPAV
jgi:hypothetical protein